MERRTGRLTGWEEVGRRLCDFRAERRVERWEVVAVGSEGWVEEVRFVCRLSWEVVGRSKG